MAEILLSENCIKNARPYALNGKGYQGDKLIGHYEVTCDAAARLESDPDLVRQISIPIIEARIRGDNRPVLISEGKTSPLDESKIWEITVDELLSKVPQTAVEMFDRALVNLSYLCSHPSDTIVLDKTSARLLFGRNADQTEWMIRQLVNSRYVLEHEDGDMDWHPSLTIEALGWQKASELKRKVHPARPEAFVAMSFSAEMTPFYDDGIKPAIESGNPWKAVKINEVEHNGDITDAILAAIRRSKFVVADFTEKKGGVYFEAGFALGLGIPVIYTVKDSVAGIHFDTRQYNHIVYTTPTELKVKLANRIAATIVS